MRELTDMRTARSKTFLLDDGVTHRLEVGGPHAHHLVAGVWVETDCYLYADASSADGDDFTHSTRVHPWRIRMNRYKQPMRLEHEGHAVTVRPLGANSVAGVKSGNTIRYPSAWDGIDVARIVTPDGLVETLAVVSASGQRVVEWSVTGDMTPDAPSWTTEDASGPVPFTFAGGVLSFDLRGVPVGAVVR